MVSQDSCEVILARPERFELPTSWFVARHSIQLSYGRADVSGDFRLVPAATLLR